MNDDLDEPQFEHEEPAAQNKKRTKKKRPRDNDDDDDATPGAPPILEESAAAAAEPASTAPVAFQTAGGPAKKPKPPRAAPRDGATWAAWLRNLLPDADAAALPARCAPPEGDVKMAVAARVRRGPEAAASTQWSFVPRPGGPRTSPGRSATTRRSGASSSSSASTKIGRSRSAPSRR